MEPGRQFENVMPSGHREMWEPGSRAHYEYHCYEGHDSSDAPLWYRSHQQVTVLHHNAEDERANGVAGLSFHERSEEGAPRTYQVHFDDGHRGTAWEDELVVHPKHFYRPDPPRGPES